MAGRSDHNQALLDQLEVLNLTFLRWLSDQIPQHPQDSFMDACQDYIDHCTRLCTGNTITHKPLPQAKSQPTAEKLERPGSAGQGSATSAPSGRGSASKLPQAFPSFGGLSNGGIKSTFAPPPISASAQPFGTASFGLPTPSVSAFGLPPTSAPLSTSLFGQASAAAPTTDAVGGEEEDAEQAQESQVEIGSSDNILFKATATLNTLEDGKWKSSGSGVLTLREAKATGQDQGGRKPFLRMTTTAGRIILNSGLIPSSSIQQRDPKKPMKRTLPVLVDGRLTPAALTFRALDAAETFSTVLSKHM